MPLLWKKLWIADKPANSIPPVVTPNPAVVLGKDERYLQLDKALDFLFSKQLQAFLKLAIAECTAYGTFHSSRFQHGYISFLVGVILRQL